MAETGGLEVARHEGPLAALERDFDTLADPRHPGAVFRSYAWISAWWNGASPEREAAVLTARAGGRVVGILPLYAEPLLLGGRRLRFMGDGIVGSDFLGVVARPEDASRAARAFAAFLRDRGDELQLDDLLPDDPLLQALRDGQRRAFRVQPRYRCPFIRLAGDFDRYLARLPDGLGAQWHRRRRWLERTRGFQVSVLSSPADVAHGMDILFDLHRQRWALEGGSDAIDGPRTERFHREAAQKLAERGWARLWMLEAEGAPRAVLYGFRHGDRFAFYQAGHEPAWRPRSVGTVLLGHVLRACFAEGLSEFDFLRGDEPYKLRWASGWRETMRACARGRGLGPLLAGEAREWWTRLKGAAKQALPAPALAWVRVKRRSVTARLGGAT